MAEQRRFRSRKPPAKKTGSRPLVVSRRKPDRHQSGAISGHTRGGAASPWDPLLAGVLIFAIASPALVGPWGQRNGYTPDLHMAAYIQVSLMVILTLFVLSTLGRKRIVVPRSPLLLPLAAFYGWAMLSISWADAKYEAVVDGLEWSAAFVGALLAILILRNSKLIGTMLLGLLISGLLISLLVIGQYLLGIDWVLQHIVPGATFANKNMAGQYGLLTLPIAVVFFLRTDKKYQIWLLAVVIALMTAHIFYTHSRGSWLSFGLQFLLFALSLAYLKFGRFRSSGERYDKKVPATVALLLVLGLCYMTPSLLGTAETVERTSIGALTHATQVEHGGEMLRDTVTLVDGSYDIRLTIWANSIPMFKEHFLLGVGLGNWTVHYPRYQSWYRQDPQLLLYKYHANAHNDYVEILCELGIIGFALFVWFVVSLFRVAGALLRRGDKEHFFLALPMIIALAGIALSAMFSFPLKQPVPAFLLMIYAAALSNLYGATVNSGREHVLSLPAQPIKAAAAAVAVLVTASVFSLHYNWHQSELHYRSALLEKEKKQYRQFHEEIEKAIAFNPLNLHLLKLQAFAISALGGKQADEKNAAVLEEVMRAYPYDLTTVLNLQSAYRRLHRTDASIDLLEDMLTVTSHEKVWRRYGEVLRIAGRYSDGAEGFKEFWIPTIRFKYLKRRGNISPSLFESFEEKFNIGMNGFSLDNDPRVRMSNIEKLMRFCHEEFTSPCADLPVIKRLSRSQRKLHKLYAKLGQLERRIGEGHGN